MLTSQDGKDHLDFGNVSILLTGGTGSFGHAFVDVALRDLSPKKLIIFSRDELKQSEMQKRFKLPALRFFLGDVRDRERLNRAMRGVDVVVHAAALKQVPACEYNPFEAVKTNVNGAENVIDAAIDCGVKKVLALSSDKAVHPINLYGATKLCAEKLFIQANAYSGAGGTRFACARYGNVVGSRGSVIPLFQAQRKNGVVTVTDSRMTRFWITLEQGVRFVLRSISHMKGGEVFVPKIPSMDIMSLVEAIAPGCKIEYTGIRPGEKLHEVLVSSDEARHTLEFPEMFLIQPAHPSWGREHWPGGAAVEDDFTFTSDGNPHKLTLEELRGMISRLEASPAALIG